MKYLTILPVLLLCGCASSQHVKRGDYLLFDLSKAVARLHPENQNLQDIASRAGVHARETASFDIAGIIEKLFSMIEDYLPYLVAALFGGAGIVSPGITKRKSQKGTEKHTPPSP